MDKEENDLIDFLKKMAIEMANSSNQNENPEISKISPETGNENLKEIEIVPKVRKEEEYEIESQIYYESNDVKPKKIDNEKFSEFYSQDSSWSDKNKEKNFYERKINEAALHQKKMENLRIRKLKEEEKLFKKPELNENTKKIISKKFSNVKPIYERANEITDQKKAKVDNLKKLAEESKIQEESVYSKVSNCQNFDEKRFEEWRKNQLKWKQQKEEKIEFKKQEKMIEDSEIMKSLYHPNIDKRSQNIAKSKILTEEKENITVYEKLYNIKDEKYTKLVKKMVENLPTFTPVLTAKTPNYLKTKSKVAERMENKINQKSSLTPVKNKDFKPPQKKKIRRNSFHSVNVSIDSKMDKWNGKSSKLETIDNNLFSHYDSLINPFHNDFAEKRGKLKKSVFEDSGDENDNKNLNQNLNNKLLQRKGSMKISKRINHDLSQDKSNKKLIQIRVPSNQVLNNLCETPKFSYN